MARYKLVLEYDGADFAGYQFQPAQRTVQGVVEDALASICGHAVRLRCAGRTDAGVHAAGQVVAFSSESGRTGDEVCGGLNGMLPLDVACVSAEVVADEFDPRHWSWGKVYRYRFLTRAAPSPLRRRRTWRVRGPLDVRAMSAAAAHWVGEHDFSSFRASGCSAKHPVRVVTALQVTETGDEVVLEARGQGFLRHMVRIMAGTLRDVGKGRLTQSQAAAALAARSRSAAGQTAPPHGLELVRVLFGDGPPPWKS